MFEGVIGYIIGGAVIGILARFFKPGADPMGWILTILLGIAGALVGSRLAAMLNLTGPVMVWVCAIVAAIILLFIYEAIRKKTVKTA
ncbi:GlsB/YeaQ/YmgE family stress response membrane protein [Lysobacter yangpyeongensis]|uniref:GlsB/YeaQ/YmgE family stress response membrane protein n=1 Tax=Lysobacter yangpyeongensis TaxID=346182 RepID=A0ABW0SLY0_9GAMM